jgi:hypothetical protein
VARVEHSASVIGPPPSGMRTLSERCNAWLTGGDGPGRDAVRQLETAGRNDERLHTYNRAPLLNRPGLLQAADVSPLQHDLSTLLDVLVSLPDRLFDGDTAAMCERVGIHGPARQAVLDTVDDRSVLLARADVVWSPQGPKAIEFNIHSSLGGMDIGPLNETFVDLPVYGDFLRAESLKYHDPLDAILAEVQQAATTRGMTNPTVALVDWPTSYPTYEPVLERLAALMRARGIPTVPTHVGRLEERNGYLWCGRIKIDVLYRIFMLEDIPEQPDLITPILKVHRAGNVLLAMGFFAELVGNKAALALLSEPTAPDFLTPAERAVIDRVLPQTRFLRPGQTTWDAERGDITDVAVARKHDLILKPAIGHGTLGVVPGWSVSDEEWRRALQAAEGDVFVVQQRVCAVPEQIPHLADDEWTTRAYDVNWGVFIHQGRYAGAMLRALPSSQSGIISLGAGGAVGCCFFAEASDDQGD